MRRFAGLLLWVALVLAVPIVPFMIWGAELESAVESWFDANLPPWSVAGLVVGLLTSDILLPIPSSVVGTVAGNRLGFWLGTGASWLGMTLGSVLAFALVRRFGRPLAAWWVGEEELARMDLLSQRYGPWILVLARPLPVLAESSVLLFGATRLEWRAFLVPLALSNLGIAAVYALLGDRVALPVALGASLALPILAAGLARWLFCAGRARSVE